MKGSELKKSISGKEGGLFAGNMDPELMWEGNKEVVFSVDSGASGFLSGPGDATWRMVTRLCWGAWIADAKQYWTEVQMDKNRG